MGRRDKVKRSVRWSAAFVYLEVLVRRAQFLKFLNKQVGVVCPG